MNFEQFLAKINPVEPLPLLIALDPGETTGYAVYQNGKLIDAGQLPTSYIIQGIQSLEPLLDKYLDQKPYCVFENYRIYSWKTETHTWAELHTPQMLGVIETLCYVRGIKCSRQMAQQAKQFCTDDKLKMWGYYKPGLKHARDAIRHGCYYLLFNNKPNK